VHSAYLHVPYACAFLRDLTHINTKHIFDPTNYYVQATSNMQQATGNMQQAHRESRPTASRHDITVVKPP
jgi:hypothetical protein